MEKLITDYLFQIEIGSPQSHKNLVVYPLLSGYRDSLTYANLDEALEKNLIAVTEVSEDGLVPQLRVVNLSETPVLIVDGEELVGAKQNRAVNTTILIAAGAETVIPVSCVEQGRWTYKTREFKSEGRVMSSKIRASKADQVRCSLRDSGRFASDQGAIWGAIQDLVQGFDVESPSTAMADVYRKERPALAEYTREFSPIDQQVGGVFVINGRFAGVETFGKPETFTKLFLKLVESYALEAINTGAEDFTASPVSHERVLCFLGGILGCDFESRPSVGLGIDVRLESIVTTGFALVHEGQFLHLSAFSSWKF